LVIELSCRICRRRSVVDPADLLRRHGDREIDRVRWQCSCGVRRAHMFLASKDP
jgi:hypothetical protein